MGLTVTSLEASANTGDVLHDTAMIEEALALAEGESLSERKQEIQGLSDKIKAINHLSDLLRNHRPTGSDTGATGDLGSDKAAIIAGMKSFCGATYDTSDADDSLLTQGAYDQWLQSLSGASSDLSSQSQQIQADVSAVLGRYNGAMDAASGMVKKRESLGDSVANNYRTS